MSVVNAKCPNCGASIQLDNGRSEGFCSYCGSKVKVEEAQKLIIQGTVKLDTSDELANLYQIARRAKDANNCENAYRYYDMILIKDPDSWEATFYVTYYQAMQCTIENISSAAYSICNCEEQVLDLIKTNVEKERQRNILQEIYEQLASISSMFFNAAKDYYESIDTEIQNDYLQEYINNASASADVMYSLGNLVISKFGNEYGSIASLAWKDAIEIHKDYVKYLQDQDGNIKFIDEYVQKIQELDSTYQKPEVETSGGCYVATAIYGSYDCPEVWVLRRFRDNTLDNYLIGRWFIKVYYAISPALVRWFGETSIFKCVLTPVLDRFVSYLRRLGTSDEPYNDKY